MNFQYQFELVFIRLTLKRNLLGEGVFRVSLIQPSKELTPTSTFQAEEIKIRKNQKIVQLDALNAFKFSVKDKNQSGNFLIKYEIKSNSDERVRSIPVNVNGMINDYQQSQKSTFEQHFGGQNADLSFKFYLIKQQPEQTFNFTITPSPQQKKINMNRSNSISRSKRPPDLNLNRRNGPGTNSSRINQRTESAPKVIEGGAIIKLIGADSPDSIGYLQKDTPSLQTVSNLQKKVASLPLSEIEKVSELINHHRQQQHPTHLLSYKLKIVIAMLIIGIFFLLYDTLSDRSIKRSKRNAQKRAEEAKMHQSHNDHEQKQEQTTQRHPKKHEKKQNQRQKSIPKQQRSKSLKKQKSKGDL